MTDHATSSPRLGAAPTPLLLAAVLGLVHAGFSTYWGLGGTWLRDTLGARIVHDFSGMVWALLPVAAVKAGFALLPLLVTHLDGQPEVAVVWRGGGRAGAGARRRALSPCLLRACCWAGAAVLVLWGGVNTVVGNLVLAGVVRPDGGYDRMGMIGHAWLWDPLFLLWGLALAAGLVRSGRGGLGLGQPRVRGTQ